MLADQVAVLKSGSPRNLPFFKVRSKVSKGPEAAVREQE
jgi:hypothetical protein